MFEMAITVYTAAWHEAHIKPDAEQSVQRVFVIFLATQHRTVAVTATEMSDSPATYDYDM